MKKKIIITVSLISLILISYFAYIFLSYSNTQKKNNKLIAYCSQNNTKECYTKMFELLLPELLIYNVQKDKKELALLKYDKTPTWNTFLTYEQSDAFVVFYSIALHTPINITDYQNRVSKYFQLKLYELHQIENKQLKENQQNLLNLLDELRQNKQKIVLKLDILNLNNDFFSKILEYKDVINGFLIFLHLDNPRDIIEAKKFLKQINKNYVLTSRNSDYGNGDVLFLNTTNMYKEKSNINTKYYNGYIYDSTLILSFINKELIDEYKISMQQNTDKVYTGEKVHGHRPLYKTPKSDINWVVTITEIIKDKLKKYRYEK